MRYIYIIISVSIPLRHEIIRNAFRVKGENRFEERLEADKLINWPVCELRKRL